MSEMFGGPPVNTPHQNKWQPCIPFARIRLRTGDSLQWREVDGEMKFRIVRDESMANAISYDVTMATLPCVSSDVNRGLCLFVGVLAWVVVCGIALGLYLLIAALSAAL